MQVIMLLNGMLLNFASGVYYYRIVAGDFISNKKTHTS